MNFSELALSRYSVRKFKNEKLKESDIQAILDAARLAPTGCNNQPQRILVIKSDEAVEKLTSCTKCHFNAPCAMLVCYNKDECWRRKYDGKSCGVADASIVTTFMMMQATEIGVGTTWVMHFDPSAMKEKFNIPENVEPVALLVMGYPHEDSVPLDLHSIYRDQSENVIYDTF